MTEVSKNPADPSRPLGFTLLRVPFFLEPDYPETPEFEETNRTRLVRKWGGQEGWDAQKRRHNLKGRGQEVGIEHFNLDRVASNTLSSHRLVQWATKQVGIQVAEELYNELNHRHFVEGKKLNDRPMLIDAARKVGLDAVAAESFLDSSEGVSEITASSAILRSIGVSGIPTFVLGGKQMLPSGAMHQSVLVEAFREAEASAEGLPGNLFADALGIPSHVQEQILVF